MYIVRFILLIISFSALSLHAKVILWDLGGVLCQPDKLGVAKEIGLGYFASYAIFDFKNPNIQQLLFDILEQMEKPERGVREKAGTGEGMPLPTIMCQWQAGITTGPEIIKRSYRHLKMLESIDYFDSDRERVLVEKTIQAMFDPQVLARNVRPVKKGFDLVKLCGDARNADGTKKNRNFVFSNWDNLSFDIFYKNNRGLFKPFEAVVISGHIKLIKPRRESFMYLLEKYKLNARDCILIDDQEVNVTAARKCGIKSIHVQNLDFDHVVRELKMYGAL